MPSGKANVIEKVKIFAITRAGSTTRNRNELECSHAPDYILTYYYMQLDNCGASSAVCYRSGGTVTPIGAAKNDKSILVHVLRCPDSGLQRAKEKYKRRHLDI
jgi:hypothetical protein